MKIRMGVDLGGTKTELLALDESGRELWRERRPTPASSYEEILKNISSLVENCEARLGLRGSVGVGIPGVSSPVTGKIKNSNTLCLIGKELDKDLERLLKRPIRLANDANCFALSEATDGSAAGAHGVFGVILGTGVGGGIVVGGKILTGANAIAGEWGHNPLPWSHAEEHPGLECYCGRRGCIETFLSGPALRAQFFRETKKDLEPPEIAKLAESGDGTAEALLGVYELRLARALSSVVNLIDPDMIVLGGGLSNFDRLYKNVPRLWEKFIFSDHVATKLRPAKFGDSSGVRGAAWLWPL
jgi:fructokinase